MVSAEDDRLQTDVFSDGVEAIGHHEVSRGLSVSVVPTVRYHMSFSTALVPHLPL
jgi:hypothetical protein